MSAFEKYEFTLPCPLRAQSSAERSWRKHAFDAGVAHGLEMASQLVRKQARTAGMLRMGDPTGLDKAADAIDALKSKGPA